VSKEYTEGSWTSAGGDIVACSLSYDLMIKEEVILHHIKLVGFSCVAQSESVETS